MKRIVRKEHVIESVQFPKLMAKNKSQSIQRRGKLEWVEVISNNFIREDDLEQSLQLV